VHELVVHLLPVPFPRYGLPGEHPAPVYRRNLEGDFRQGLETERAERVLLVCFCDDVRGCCRVERWKDGPTVSVNLRALFTYENK